MLTPWLAVCQHLPRWEQGEGRAAAVIFPPGVILGFSFISSKTRGTGKGSKDSRRLKERGDRSGTARDRDLQRARGRDV